MLMPGVTLRSCQKYYVDARDHTSRSCIMTRSGVTIDNSIKIQFFESVCEARLSCSHFESSKRKNSMMYLPKSILLLIIFNLAASSAGGIRRRLQGERIDSLKGAVDLRGGSRVDPENIDLLELAALRKVVLDGECSDVCDVTSNPDWVCADENSHLVCHQGKTKCIPAVSYHTHCLSHNDTCGPCTDADTGEPECGTCDGQGECEIEEVEICHKKRTKCVSSDSWLGHCFNHGDTCGACPLSIEEGEDDGDEDGFDSEVDVSKVGVLDASACAAPCSQEDSPALQLCAEEDPNTFPVCHKGKITVCVSPDSWSGHCLRHSDTCGPCSESVDEAEQSQEGEPNGGGDEADPGDEPDDPAGLDDSEPSTENSNAGGNGNSNSGCGFGTGPCSESVDEAELSQEGEPNDGDDEAEPGDEPDDPAGLDDGEPSTENSNTGGNGNGNSGCGFGCSTPSSVP